MSILRRTRRAAYRTGSILGDVQAVKSGSPRKIAARYVRKSILRRLGGLINRSIR